MLNRVYFVLHAIIAESIFYGDFTPQNIQGKYTKPEKTQEKKSKENQRKKYNTFWLVSSEKIIFL